MSLNLTRKTLESHLAKPSEMSAYFKVYHTLTHDINAVMTYLVFEAIGLDRTQGETSVSYLDNNMLYLDFKPSDDHIYLQTAAQKYGVYASRPGNEICHAVHATRFGKPSKLSMGGDSHTPHGVAIGMLCIGVGGMDVATGIWGFSALPKAPAENLTAKISLKTEGNASVDDITPASAEFSSMRSNIPMISKYCFHRYAPEFAERAKSMGQSIIIGGENYGQGLSREHAAINPMFLDVKCVIAKNIERIHKGNLVNHGIVPMLFENPADYDRLEQGDTL